MLMLIAFYTLRIILFPDFSDRLGKGQRTGYEVPRTEYEMVNLTLIKNQYLNKKPVYV